MDCARTREKLEAYHYGMLDDLESAQVAGHLESCAGCASELKEVERTAALLGLWEAVPAGEAAPASLGAGALLVASAPCPASRARFSWRKALAAGMAGAVLGFLAGSFGMLKAPEQRPASVEIARDLHPLPLDDGIMQSLIEGEGR